MDDDLSGFSMEIVPDSQAIVCKVLRDGVHFHVFRDSETVRKFLTIQVLWIEKTQCFVGIA